MPGCFSVASENIDAFKTAMFPLHNTRTISFLGAGPAYKRFIRDSLESLGHSITIYKIIMSWIDRALRIRL